MSRLEKSRLYRPRGRLGWPANLWLIPAVSVASCLAIFVIAQAVDQAKREGRISLPGWVDEGGAVDALALLSATAGGIITTLGLVLSITVVVFTMVSSQFGQRPLREFIRDRGTQITIGVFAAAFVFNLMTMLSVTARPNEPEFVPWVSIWVSLLLAMSCMGMLIYYINHVAVEIQVGVVLEHLVADFRYVVSRQSSLSSLPAPDGFGGGGAAPISAPDSGYLQSIDYAEIVRAATECEASVRFLVRPGCFLFDGSPIAEVRPDSGDRNRGEAVVERLSSAIASAVSIGERRNLEQDPEFALAQITEIAERAMSPAVNDPNTMFTSIEWVGDCLRLLVAAPRHEVTHRDPAGRVRLLECPMRFDEVVVNAFGPLRQASRDSPAASVRMLDTIASLAPFMGAEEVAPLLAEADLIRDGLTGKPVSRDVSDVNAAHKRAIAALHLRLTAKRS
jgi:uncharacterized membrane protein